MSVSPGDLNDLGADLKAHLKHLTVPEQACVAVALCEAVIAGAAPEMHGPLVVNIIHTLLANFAGVRL